MALINCPECSNSVSDNSLKCPSCGVQLRKPKRSFFGKIIKWGFILFNVIMAFWLVGGMNVASEAVNTGTTAEQIGGAIGSGLGIAMILTMWVIGDIILGLFVLLTHP
ncbi:hypothetical protein LWT42_22585, partial [Enterobacter hormaechei]|nr:hypothetical protein [Enterobacter hormaechei]